MTTSPFVPSGSGFGTTSIGGDVKAHEIDAPIALTSGVRVAVAEEGVGWSCAVVGRLSRGSGRQWFASVRDVGIEAASFSDQSREPSFYPGF
jgi:hypothetical protein